MTALSLLFGLATVALWVRSYWIRDLVSLEWAGGNSHTAQSIHGRLYASTFFDWGYEDRVDYGADRPSVLANWPGNTSGHPPVARWRSDFIWQTYTMRVMGLGQPYSMTERLIVVPHWFPAGMFALAPLAWAAGVRRRVGVLDLMILVAAVALVLALPGYLARWMNQAGHSGVFPDSGFRLPHGGRQGDGARRAWYSDGRGEGRSDPRNPVSGVLAVDQVLVVLADILGQVAHQGGVNLFETGERFFAVFEHRFMAGLPALEFGDLTGTLFPVDLRGLAGEFQLLALNLQTLPLDFQGLRLQIDEQMEERDRIVGVGDDGRRPLSGRRDFHPVRPVRRRRVLS